MVRLVNWQYLWAHKKWWVVLRYYATFKVRRFESLFYKIHVSKTRLQKTTTCLGLRVEQIFSLSIQYIYIYIFIFGYGFCDSFSMLFPEGPGSCDKEILRNFLLHSTSISMSSKGLSQIFKILFQTGYVNIFVLRGVVFSRYVQLKRSFSAKKIISRGIWYTLQYRSHQTLTRLYIKGKFHNWQKLELCKVVSSS